MASIKAVLRKNKQRQDGTIPIAIRITKDRKSRFLFTGQYVLEKHWNPASQVNPIRKSHPNSTRLNYLIQAKITEANEVLLAAESSNEVVSSHEVKQKVRGTRSKQSFFAFAAERVKRKYQAGVFSVAKAERSILCNIHEFATAKPLQPLDQAIAGIKERRSQRIAVGKQPGYSFLKEMDGVAAWDNLYFEMIDEAFLHRFEVFCVSHLGISKRTITNQILLIRTLFNEAIREGIVDAKHYPFAGDKVIIRIQPSHKIGLTQEEIERVMALDLEVGSAIWHTRNVWLLSFFFAGVRISDVLKLKWSDFKDGRLYYVMNKNQKKLSLKVPEKAQLILDTYAGDKKHKNDFVFPDLKHANLKDAHDVFVKSRNATSRFNKYLKRIAELAEIEKNLSNHISRHSFGNIAGDKINPLMLQKLYRHSSIKTTIGYQANFIHKDADDALDQVVGF